MFLVFQISIKLDFAAYILYIKYIDIAYVRNDSLRTPARAMFGLSDFALASLVLVFVVIAIAFKFCVFPGEK